MKSLVIIPTYNERETLGPLVEELLAVAPASDVLIVDDASPDGTGELADALSERDERVSVIHRPHKDGLAGAYRAGFRYALERQYDLVAQMDADFSHRPVDLPKLLDVATTADVVVGSRNIPGGDTRDWPLLRRLVSSGGSLYTRALLRLPVRDCTSGFRCIRRRALAAIDLDAISATGFAFQVETTYLFHRAGMRLAEAPIVFPNRVAGQSKMSPAIFGEAMWLVLRLRLRAEASRLRDRASRALAPLLSTAVRPSRRQPAVTRSLATAGGPPRRVRPMRPQWLAPSVGSARRGRPTRGSASAAPHHQGGDVRTELATPHEHVVLPRLTPCRASVGYGGLSLETHEASSAPMVGSHRGANVRHALMRLRHAARRHRGRFARFAVVGGTGVLVNSALLLALVELVELRAIVAAAVATEGAIVSNFALNSLWTFGDRRPGTSLLTRAARYNVCALGGMAITLATLALLTMMLNMPYFLANLIAICAATLSNYVANARWTWSSAPVRQPLAQAEADGG